MEFPAVDAQVPQLIVLGLELSSPGFRPWTPLQDAPAVSGCNEFAAWMGAKVTFPNSQALLLHIFQHNCTCGQTLTQSCQNYLG